MNINPAEVATATVTTLAPFLPYLIYAARFTTEAIAEMVVQNGGERVWQRAQSLWQSIRGKYSDDGVITGMTTAVANAPENNGLQQILAVQLAQRLESDPDLMQELVNALGGQQAVQEVVAEQGSLIAGVLQEIEGGSGSQHIRAGEKSTIIGVTQRIKR